MEKNVEIAKILIRFYNAQAGCALSSTSTKNQEVVFTCLNRVKNDAITVKNHIRAWIQAHANEENLASRFDECLEAIAIPEAAPAPVNLAESIDLISKTVATLVAQTQTERIESEIMESVKDEVRDFMSKTYGPIERKITTVVDGVKREVKGLLHEKFDEVLKFVSNNEAVYLVGPAGSGKNVLCKQVAEALNLDFYFTNAVTQEYKLTGFTDAMGNYQPTQFYKAFTEGGLFMLDEMDASIPEVLIILNAALANGYFDFPAPIGFKKAHPNFRVIAAGNTTGHGADYQYVGRSQQDGSNLDRFALIEVDYSKQIEDGLSDDHELVQFCRDFRQASKKVGVNTIVSYRAISRLNKMVQLLTPEEALKTCLIKDLEKDDLNLIANELPASKFKDSVRKICAAM